ncbi:dihydroxyacetone kinase subunit DhaK [Schleiferilactobacillus harbinensis]|mgnify:CR=1 FL=1|uniref:dihydroxyacetone kinase subunit DhaK n=1 Tax=Schleiferilactobacillus harbinensis TaxID=304207 RepID=UPI00242B73ED|nr:dihydroxyacetone kinase subunit DhaK [Schleiferilactobacillus harbinensis]MCI1688308.1 dihydroxyacetone kinase subunit DhaK [Schleiferilactobacillus harbinensis]MCI1783469.1 dihydroxyacetone kinase subunit DhaK [Schleiferilactobacillus harbinensis]MCI1851439.1 dihydroxyacetone kinase subunit DhaK [Schleiferilactobacillus harbinensis]
MKKILNNPSDLVPEMVAGMVASYPQYVRQIPETTAVVRNDKAFTGNHPAKVGVVSGGGSGHEPLHAGFVGLGMLTAAVAGQVFTSPTPDQIYAAIKAADQGQGVLLIVKNYSGDVMNFDMAKDLASIDDISVESIVVDDDVAVEDSLYTQGRRGVAGTVYVEKIVGAAAEAGADLKSLVKLGKAVIEQTKTIGVALHAATVPEVGHPGFELGPDEMEYGVGIHNEPGYKREKMVPSAQLAKELLDKIGQQYTGGLSGKKFAVLVNGFGATPLGEQFVFANDVLQQLTDAKATVAFTKVGNYVTSLDMTGLSLTLLQLTDSKWLDYLNAPAATIGWGDTRNER